MAAAFRNALSRSAAVIAAILVSACAGGLTPPQLALPSLPKVEVPQVKLPEVKMPKFELPKGIGPVVGTPTEVYTRIARGAMLCWFGSNGPLKGKYIYHADAESPAKGGRAEIGIHLIDRDAPSPRGVRVYKIGIEPAGKTAQLTVDKTKLPDALAQRMWEDAHRWAATEEPDVACNDTPIDGGWQPQAAEPPVPVPAPPSTKKADAKKVPTKKAATN